MKTGIIELNVDFIGGQEPLTEKEQKALSNYFQEKKSIKTIRKSTTRKPISKSILEKV